MVMTRAGLFIVELKRQDYRKIDIHDLRRRTAIRSLLTTPLILSNSKAKKLGDILGRQKALRGLVTPWVSTTAMCCRM